MGFIKIGNRLTWIDSDFKESDHPRDDSGKFGSGGSGKEPSKELSKAETIGPKAVNPKEESLIPILHGLGMPKIKEKIDGHEVEGTILSHPMKFYHGSPKKLDELKPTYGIHAKDKTKVLNLGDKHTAEGWGDYIHEVILPAGTKIYAGMDDGNHIFVTSPIKVAKSYENKNPGGW